MTLFSIAFLVLLGIAVLGIVSQAIIDEHRHRHVDDFIAQMDRARAVLHEDDQEDD